MLEKAGEGIASDVAGLKAWKKDPDKYAVMELVWHGIGNLDIMKELDLTYDMLRELLYIVNRKSLKLSSKFPAFGKGIPVFCQDTISSF